MMTLNTTAESFGGSEKLRYPCVMFTNLLKMDALSISEGNERRIPIFSSMLVLCHTLQLTTQVIHIEIPNTRLIIHRA